MYMLKTNPEWVINLQRPDNGITYQIKSNWINAEKRMASAYMSRSTFKKQIEDLDCDPKKFLTDIDYRVIYNPTIPELIEEQFICNYYTPWGNMCSLIKQSDFFDLNILSSLRDILNGITFVDRMDYKNYEEFTKKLLTLKLEVLYICTNSKSGVKLAYLDSQKNISH